MVHSHFSPSPDRCSRRGIVIGLGVARVILFAVLLLLGCLGCWLGTLAVWQGVGEDGLVAWLDRWMDGWSDRVEQSRAEKPNQREPSQLDDWGVRKQAKQTTDRPPRYIQQTILYSLLNWFLFVVVVVVCGAVSLLFCWLGYKMYCALHIRCWCCYILYYVNGGPEVVG